MTVQSGSHSGRTYVVTGAASGIGAATVRWLRECGGRVVTSDLREADVIADLAVAEGRRALVDGAARIADRVDGIIANAGGGPVETMLALNFFGAVATIEGLRPMLGQNAPRAVLVSSASSLGPFDHGLVAACLAGDEQRAMALGREAIAAGKSGLDLYGSAKHALNRWCRREAVKPQWAGRGAALNAIAFGVIETPAAAWILNDAGAREQMKKMAPMEGANPGKAEQAAALIGWCVSPENSLMCGQVLFADGGIECLARGEATW